MSASSKKILTAVIVSLGTAQLACSESTDHGEFTQTRLQEAWEDSHEYVRVTTLLHEKIKFSIERVDKQAGELYWEPQSSGFFDQLELMQDENSESKLSEKIDANLGAPWQLELMPKKVGDFDIKLSFNSQPLCTLQIAVKAAREIDNDLAVRADTLNLRPGLMGNYGYLSDYGPMTSAEARARIRTMVEEFGIREFQFYDWFADYSHPIAGERWKDPFFKGREIELSTIKTYIDEIHRAGGRAWAYVQATGSEYNDLESSLPGVVHVRDKHNRPYLHANRFSVYKLNSVLAKYQVDLWANAVKQIGFDGIHWDTLGPLLQDIDEEAQGVHAFLIAARERLLQIGLGQTLNFVDMKWWRKDIVYQFVEFPYAELWETKPEVFLAKLDDLKLKGVFAKYPSYLSPRPERQSKMMIDLWQYALKRGSTNLLIGDGAKRLVNEYFPSGVALSEQEFQTLQQIYKNRNCKLVR